jgi:hypothetical protein
MDVFDEQLMTKNIEKIKDDMNLLTNKEFITLCTKGANKCLSEDFDIGLIILFSFDCFHMTHNCIKDLNNNGKISPDHYNILLKHLN